MNRSLLAVAMATMAFMSPAFAQTDANPNATAKRPAMAARQPQMQLRRMVQYLTLTSEQVEKIKAIMKAEAPKQLRIRTQAQRKIRAILTADQIKKYEEYLNARKAAMAADASVKPENQDAKPKRAGRNAPAPTVSAPADAQRVAPGQRVDQLRMLTRLLQLTPAQIELLKPIMKAQSAALKVLRTETQTQIKALLSADQLVKYNQLIEAQKAGMKANEPKAAKPAVKAGKKNRATGGF